MNFGMSRKEFLLTGDVIQIRTYIKQGALYSLVYLVAFKGKLSLSGNSLKETKSLISRSANEPFQHGVM